MDHNPHIEQKAMFLQLPFEHKSHDSYCILVNKAMIFRVFFGFQLLCVFEGSLWSAPSRHVPLTHQVRLLSGHSDKCSSADQ